MTDDPSARAPATIRDIDGSQPTLAQYAARSAGAAPAGEPTSLGDPPGAARYEFREVIGRGGMGEVRLYRDARIGREVALKVLHEEAGASDEAQRRFVREARVQGQLEHPTIVPVYDVGIASDGSAYFTMKRVRGATLEWVLERRRAADAEVLKRYSLRRLLTAFGSVCLSADFAHARGVIHRDLKPANVMLGEYGEVNVLDWGIAKRVGEADVPARAADDDANARAAAVERAGTAATIATAGAAAGDLLTRAGALMGTPGYMAPEQARGEVDRLDARTDVYALGAILFEIVAGAPLHDAATTLALIESTLAGVDVAARVRACGAEVPPELEALCARATAREPDERVQTARELSDAIERYLDGDRDVQRRRALADGHAAAALAAATLARTTDGPPGERARRDAMREVTRALALDPSHAGASDVFAELLTAVPTEVPAEAEAEFAQMQHAARSVASNANLVRFLAWMPLVPLLIWMGPREQRATWAMVATYPAATAAAWWLSRRGAMTGARGLAVVALSVASLSWMDGVFGPYLVTPVAIVTTCTLLALNADRAMRIAIRAFGAIALLLPIVLEVSGAIAPRNHFETTRLAIESRVVWYAPRPTLVFLVLASLIPLVVSTDGVARVRRALRLAERRAFLQAWHLRRFLPERREAGRD